MKFRSLARRSLSEYCGRVRLLCQSVMCKVTSVGPVLFSDIEGVCCNETLLGASLLLQEAPPKEHRNWIAVALCSGRLRVGQGRLPPYHQSSSVPFPLCGVFCLIVSRARVKRLKVLPRQTLSVVVFFVRFL